MNGLISKILKRRGIKSIDDLSDDERATFDKWERQLAETEITTPAIADFCKNEINKIEDKLTPDNSESKNNRLIALLTAYKAIARLINSKKEQRESLIKYLKQMGE